jgi:hypothetical protein
MPLTSGLCIAEHESHLDTAAIGTLNTDGSKDHGIFQVSRCINLQIYSWIYTLWFEETFWEQGLSSEANNPSDIEPSMERKDSLSCKIWGFHGGDYDDYHLLGNNTVWLL